MKFLSVVCVVALVVAFCMQAFAGPIDLGITKLDLPNVKEAVIVSFRTEGIENAITTEVLGYDTKIGRFELDVGAAIAINEPIVAVCYNVGDLTKLGFDFPLGKYLDLGIGAYVGFEINSYSNAGGSDSEWSDALDYGLYLKIFEIKI